MSTILFILIISLFIGVYFAYGRYAGRIFGILEMFEFRKLVKCRKK